MLRGAVVAISDGRLTRDDSSVSFNSVEKMMLFTPSYQYPVVRLGRLDGFRVQEGHKWAIAYSGNYVLATQIRDKAIARSTRLYLDRISGIPSLIENFKAADNYMDSYNFEPTELPLFDAHAIFGDFEEACRLKAEEWSAVRGFPEVEFLVFGLDQRTKQYSGCKFSFDEQAWREAGRVAVQTTRLREWDVAAIGEPSTVIQFQRDEALRTAIVSSVPAELSPDALASMSSEDLLGVEIDRAQPSSTDNVARRLVALTRSATDISVGGDLMVVIGRSSTNLRGVMVPAKT